MVASISKPDLAPFRSVHDVMKATGRIPAGWADHRDLLPRTDGASGHMLRQVLPPRYWWQE